jgi:hypothetical protein
MKKIVTVRLEQADFDILNTRSKKEGKSVSTLIREQIKSPKNDDDDLTELAKILGNMFDRIERIETKQQTQAELFKYIFRATLRSSHALLYVLNAVQPTKNGIVVEADSIYEDAGNTADKIINELGL